MQPSGVLMIGGQTASGKTELAIELARRFGAEIVCADSRQIYRGMPIGTAAPTREQLDAVPHHLVGFLDPRERYSAARFAADALAAIDDIARRGKRTIVAGGTGFYLRALAGGVELAGQFDPQLRDRLAAEARIHDAAFLYEWLRVRDPRRAAMLHGGDAYRVIRALEIAIGASRGTLREKPLPSLANRGIAFLEVFIERDWPELERRIEVRTDDLLARGLIEEAERIGGDAVAASAVGYPQALAFLRGWCTHGELRSLLIRATRRYAKRQSAWFRNEPQAHRVAPGAVAALAREKLAWV